MCLPGALILLLAVPEAAVRVVVDAEWLEDRLQALSTSDSLGYRTTVNVVHANASLIGEVEKVGENSEGVGLVGWFLSLFADITLQSDNRSEEDEPPRVGSVSLVRQPQDSFFKFLWESLRSGIVSVVGA